MTQSFGFDRTQHEDGFQFTQKWFLGRNRRTFCSYVLPQWAGKPITYLEIGVFEGMSMVWIMQQILTHPDSRAVGIDPWLQTRKLGETAMDDVRKRALHNIEPYQDRCQLIRANSGEVLSRMLWKRGAYGITKNSVDLCMVDGDHRALGMLADAKLCLCLVKPGGWLLFDDVENDHEKADHVKHGLAMFLAEHGKEVKQVFKHKYMEGYEKI